MKNLSWCLTACLVAGFCLFCYSAEAQFPKPRPAAAPQATAAPVQAPPVQVTSSEVASPPVINVAAPAPNHQFDILMWIWTALGSIFTAIQAKAAFKPAAPSAPGGLTPIDHGKSVVVDVLTKLNDPAVRQTFEAHGLQIALVAAQNPLVNTAVQTGLSAVPGLGAAEPIIRSLGIKALQDLIAKQEAKAA